MANANSYTDDIKVKISEKYKPPCKISLPMSYSQRLTLNRQIQDSRPTYDFLLENSVISKLKEWKDNRKQMVEQRRQCVEQSRKEFDKKIEKEKLQFQNNLVEARKSPNSEASVGTTAAYKVTQNNPNISSQNYVTRNGILMPIPVTTYITNSTNILSPNTAPIQSQQTSVLKPFNLSDFESDTSSPFDNMELKSINDLEELAQVLKSDNLQNNGGYSSSKSYNNFPQSNYSQNTSAFNQPYNSQINYRPVSTSYSHYSHPYGSTSNYQALATYSDQISGYLYPQMTQTYTPFNNNMTLQKVSCKSVPDLVKSLEKELDSTHLTEDPTEKSKHSTSSSFHMNKDALMPARPKSTDSICSKSRVNDEMVENMKKLSPDERELCKNVSLMGFPLERVAKVCKIIGSDQKKIVDHLLALSELLDLGFSEKDATEALMKNDNDRDKALDLLIS